MPAHLVHITLDRDNRPFPPGLTKGQALIDLAGLTGKDQLLLEVDGDVDVPIAPDDFIVIEGGEAFSIGDGDPYIFDNPVVRKPVEFVLNDESVHEHNRLPHAKATGAEVKALGSKGDTQLWLDLSGLADEQIDDAARLILRPHFRFFTVEKDSEHGGGLVTISLDDDPREIKRGEYVVSALKYRLGVPADYELDIVANGLFDPLTDDAKIKIMGGDIFVSHVRRGASS